MTESLQTHRSNSRLTKLRLLSIYGTCSPSSLRPVCLARERLVRWRPVFGRQPAFAGADIEGVKAGIAASFEPRTLETYGSGLLAYHEFGDLYNIPEVDRAPATPDVISAFLTVMVGLYSGSTVSNYLYGLRAWHAIHGVPWKPNEIETKALLTAAEKCAPPSSKRKPCLPYTIPIIVAIHGQLDLQNHLHVSAYACLTSAFHATARVGEFAVPTLDAFDPAIHIKRSDLGSETDRNGLEMKTYRVPRTKTSIHGEQLSCAKQPGLDDPETAMDHYLKLNDFPPDSSLFSYSTPKGPKHLTKRKFLEVIGSAARAAGIDPLQGHGIRIGSTLEYLLRGVPFDVMKVKGRWKSDAFIIYLRKHAQILAPYLQAVPEVHASFLRFTLASSRR